MSLPYSASLSRLWRGCLILSSVACFACQKVEVPEGPYLQGLADTYDSPDGRITSRNMEEILGLTRETLVRAEALGELRFVVATVENVSGTLREVASQGDGQARLNGSSEVEHTCPGLLETPTTDPENGALFFTVALQNSAIGEVIWGRFEACQLYEKGRSGTVNASMAMHLTGNLGLQNASIEKVLFQLKGEFISEAGTQNLDMDYRLSAGTVEVRVPAEEGHVIVALTKDELGASIRTREASFCCALDERTCYILQASSCDEQDVQVGDGSVSW